MSLHGKQATCDRCGSKSVLYKTGFLTGVEMNKLYANGWTLSRDRDDNLLCKNCVDKENNDDGEEHF